MSAINVNTFNDYKSNVRSSDWYKEMMEGWEETSENNFFFEEEINTTQEPSWFTYAETTCPCCDGDYDLWESDPYEEENDSELTGGNFPHPKDMNEDVFLIKKLGKWTDDFKLAAKKRRSFLLKEKMSSELNAGEIRKIPYKRGRSRARRVSC